MFPRMFQTLLLGAALLPAISATCHFYQGLDWDCQACRPSGDGQSPVFCIPQNATFDDYALGPINKYRYAHWQNFTNVKVGASNQVQPYSPPNYAKLAGGQHGLIDMSPHSGALYSLRYACTAPGAPGKLTSCTLNITAPCQLYSDNGPPYPFHQESTVLHYTAPKTANYSLAYGTGFYPTVNQGLCLNYTFSAVSSTGAAVDLYIDDVIFGIYETTQDEQAGSSG